MKYSTKLSDTIHILIFIALGDDEQLSSKKLQKVSRQTRLMSDSLWQP